MSTEQFLVLVRVSFRTSADTFRARACEGLSAWFEAMNHLDYDEGDEDLTVRFRQKDGTTYCCTNVNTLLLKMLSPWWRAKMTSSGFKGSVNDGRCVIVHENPMVAELALKAAKLRLQQVDLVAEGDLGLAFSIWQLADM